MLYKSGAAPPARGGDAMLDIGDEEEEADFPDVAMEELLDDVENMSLQENNNQFNQPQQPNPFGMGMNMNMGGDGGGFGMQPQQQQGFGNGFNGFGN
jgi:hypothetical protein